MQVAGVIFCVLLALIGIFGNIFIILAICLDRQIRSIGYVFIANLAVADLLMCLTVIPVNIVTGYFERNVFSSTFCRIVGMAAIMNCSLSILSLMAVGINRYVHICKSPWYNRVFTKRLTALYIALIWVYSAVLVSIPLTEVNPNLIYSWDKKQYACNLYRYGSSWLLLLYQCCIVTIPMIITTATYVRIFYVVWKSKRNVRAHRREQIGACAKTAAEKMKITRERKMVITVVLTSIMFIICWSPLTIMVIIDLVNDQTPVDLYQVGIWFALANSAVNCIIYGLTNPYIRHGYKTAFHRVFRRCTSKDQDAPVTLNSNCTLIPKSYEFQTVKLSNGSEIDSTV